MSEWQPEYPGSHQMSALIGHAKAARILGACLMKQANEEAFDDRPDASVANMLGRMSLAFVNAADLMEQAMREEATGREETT